MGSFCELKDRSISYAHHCHLICNIVSWWTMSYMRRFHCNCLTLGLDSRNLHRREIAQMVLDSRNHYRRESTINCSVPNLMAGINVQLWHLTLLFHLATLLHYCSIWSTYNKNTLETCKNARPTSGWSEFTKSCTTSTMNFHMAYFSWIPQDNARLKLSCKFGESKCNPYWHITLTTSHGMNYVLNQHLDFSQHDPYAIPSVIILWYS